MKKLLLFSFFAFYLTMFCGAQNLVPNCSFEDTIGCPDGLGYIDYAKGWYSAERAIVSSPDYFFNCDGFIMVPQNFIDFQYASTGEAYTGIFPWMTKHFDTIYDTREFIGVRLTNPLVVGQNYYVSFKVNLAVGYASAFASNKTGLLFSMLAYNAYNPTPINNFAHVYTNQIITDTTQWTTISGWVTADSAYEYITIGNFFEDDSVSTSRVYPYMGSWDTLSYYFIDDVCVSLDSTKCSCELPNGLKEVRNTEIKIYPNPSVDLFTVSVESSLQNFSLRIYDTYGRLIKSIENLRPGENTITTNDLANGIYFLKGANDKNEFVQTIIINH